MRVVLQAIALFLALALAKRMKALSTSIKKSSLNKLHIQWFKNTDLRLHDNPALIQGIKKSQKDGIVPMYCFDIRLFGGKSLTEFGNSKIGARRAQFLLESVQDLRKELESKGSRLWVELGTPEQMFKNISESSDQLDIYCQEEVTSEELSLCKNVRAIVNERGGRLESIWGSTLYHPSDLPYYGGITDMPDTFTPFRNKVESKCSIGSPLPSPEKIAFPSHYQFPKHCEQSGFDYLPSLCDLGYDDHDMASINVDSRSVMRFRGGESVAQARLKDYIWEKDLLKVYFETRNGMIGADYSSKLSPWLAHGCISPRYIAAQCAKYEEQRVKNKSTYWLVFELLWRDFFRFFAIKHRNSIFHLDGTLGEEAHGSHPNSRRWSFDARHFNAWKEGKTGYPLVDANMRELAASGFMSNRGRQIVASFLAIDLSMDWRYGADYFESVLLDYDVCSNWGNWCAAAGMTGGRLNRFNIAKQGKDYDPMGEYVKLWCPELTNLPPNLVHEPWKMSPQEQSLYGVKLGIDYPNRIPTVPFSSQYSRNSGDRKGSSRGPNVQKAKPKGKRQANGQREMKSLKQGSYRIL